LVRPRDAEEVADAEADHVVAARERDLDGPTVGRLFDRVVDKVGQHLPHLVRIPGDGR
jgi:hypothetical protein